MIVRNTLNQYMLSIHGHCHMVECKTLENIIWQHMLGFMSTLGWSYCLSRLDPRERYLVLLGLFGYLPFTFVHGMTCKPERCVMWLSYSLPTHVGGEVSRRLPPAGKYFFSALQHWLWLGAPVLPLARSLLSSWSFHNEINPHDIVPHY